MTHNVATDITGGGYGPYPVRISIIPIAVIWLLNCLTSDSPLQYNPRDYIRVQGASPSTTSIHFGHQSPITPRTRADPCWEGRVWTPQCVVRQLAQHARSDDQY